MTTVHRNTQLPPRDRDMPGHIGAALKRLVELISAWRIRRRSRRELRAQSDFVREDIRRTSTRIDPELLRLEWF